MTLVRLSLWAILAVGFASTQAAAQDPTKLPQLTVSNAMTELRDTRTIPKAELPKAQDTFRNFAKYYADTVSHPLVHKAAQDPGLKLDGAGRTIPSVDDIIKSLDRFLLVPNPMERTSSDNLTPKVNRNNADYMRELGAAMDLSLKAVIDSTPDRVVRIGALRVYVAVCRSGAFPLWPTVTNWLKNANTPTEVKYYALQAAANLLEAYDVTDYRSRRHAIGKDAMPKADEAIGALVAAIEEVITNPNAIVPIPGGKVENTPPDQLGVIAFVRRQAVKSLSQVRFVTLPGPEGKPLYPVVTLARVAMSDPTLIPAPTPGECGEAVIGLCNMSQVVGGNPVKGFNADAVCEAITTGLITFAGPRAANPLDRSLPWRGYSMRIGDALKGWRPIFDPLFDPSQPTKFDSGTVPKGVSDLILRAQTSILTPMDKVDLSGKPDLSVRVDIEGMKVFLKQLQGNPKRSPFIITGVPATALPGASK